MLVARRFDLIGLCSGCRDRDTLFSAGIKGTVSRYFWSSGFFSLMNPIQVPDYLGAKTVSQMASHLPGYSLIAFKL
jgi:hypothetical protein